MYEAWRRPRRGDVRGPAADDGTCLTAATDLDVDADRGARGRDQGAALGVVGPDDWPRRRVRRSERRTAPPGSGAEGSHPPEGSRPPSLLKPASPLHPAHSPPWRLPSSFEAWTGRAGCSPTPRRRPGTDAKVPTCPDWQVRDLLRHTGMVHRWATAFVAEGHTSYHPDGGLPGSRRRRAPGLVPGRPRAPRRHARLRPARRASAGVSCPRRRRSPSGPGGRRTRRPCTGWTPSRRAAAPRARSARDFAVDGIDELLLGFHARAQEQGRSGRTRVSAGAGHGRGRACGPYDCRPSRPATERDGVARRRLRGGRARRPALPGAVEPAAVPERDR